MKLISLLRCMDENEHVRVFDDKAPVTLRPLFTGRVKDCKTRGDIRNGVVTVITPDDRLPMLIIHIDIEYQKKRALKEESTNETI